MGQGLKGHAASLADLQRGSCSIHSPRKADKPEIWGRENGHRGENSSDFESIGSSSMASSVHTMSWTPCLPKERKDMAPAAGAYTAILLKAIVYDNNRRCTFMPVLPNSGSPDDALPSDANTDKLNLDSHAKEKFSELPQTPLVDVPEGILQMLCQVRQ